MMTHFRVRNYKCLADVSIPLTPIHVLVGQNDAGKTSLLEAMRALLTTVHSFLPVAFTGAWQGTELVYDQAAKPSIEFDAAFRGVASGKPMAFSYHLEIEFGQGVYSCRRIDEWYDDGTQAHQIAELRQDTTGLFTRFAPTLSGIERERLANIAKVIGGPRLYRLDPKTMAVPAASDVVRKFALDPDGFGLATLLDDIAGYDPMSFISLRDEFLRYFPQFKTLRLETENASVRHYNESGVHQTTAGVGKGIFFLTTHGKTVRAQQASDGAILFLGFLALMYSPEPPSLLLIEEPERGIYPKRLAEVVHLLRRLEASASERPVPQIVLTTHSPYLLSAFSPEEVTVLNRDSPTGPVRARPLRDAPRIHEHLERDEFYLGELWYNLSEDALFADA